MLSLILTFIVYSLPVSCSLGHAWGFMQYQETDNMCPPRGCPAAPLALEDRFTIFPILFYKNSNEFCTKKTVDLEETH